MTRNNTTLIVLILFLSSYAIAQNTDTLSTNNNRSSMKPPQFCVLLHSPGPNWQRGVPFREQPGVGEHVQYMSKQLKSGLLLIGGPFLDNSGGMMVRRTSDIEKAKLIAESDPAVKKGLLKVEVKKWMVPMTSVDLSVKKDED